MDPSCSRLFMSYFFGYFQSLGVWQQLSRLSPLLFLHLGVSTSHSLSSLALVKLYCSCLIILICMVCNWFLSDLFFVLFYHLRTLSSLVLVKLYFPCLFMLILYGLQLMSISLVPCILLSSVVGSFPWCSDFLSGLSFCQGLQKVFDGICSCFCCEKCRLVFCCPLIFFFYVVSNIKIFCPVEGFFSYIIHIIIHTIHDAVGIPNWCTLCISRGCRLNTIVSHYVFTVQTIHHWIHERYISIISLLIV